MYSALNVVPLFKPRNALVSFKETPLSANVKEMCVLPVGLSISTGVIFNVDRLMGYFPEYRFYDLTSPGVLKQYDDIPFPPNTFAGLTEIRAEDDPHWLMYLPNLVLFVSRGGLVMGRTCGD